MTNETKWSLDQSHSDIAFKVRHLMIANVKGNFKTFDATIYTTGSNFSTTQIDFWIDTTSIDTGDIKRDEHLKGPDFFDCENHKQITFVSSSIGKIDLNNTHELWGELTIKGIKKNVKLNVEFGGIAIDSYGTEKAGFTIIGKINRGEWGLVWNSIIEAGGFLVSDEVDISCEIELINVAIKEKAMELEPTIEKKELL